MYLKAKYLVNLVSFLKFMREKTNYRSSVRDDILGASEMTSGPGHHG